MVPKSSRGASDGGAVEATESRFLRTTSRVLAVVWLIGVLASHGCLSRSLGGSGGIRDTVFAAAYWLGIVASCFLVVRAPVMMSTVVAVLRRAPIRSAILLVNVAVFALLALNVFSQWGVIALLLLGEIGLIACLVISERKRLETVDRLVRLSPVSFALLYLCLGVGETFLRYNPLLVGGGGGGNPALRQLYSGLYSTNSRGLRDDEFTTERPVGVCRILVLGDSFTYGQGVRFEETYVQQMESLLNSSGNAVHYEVINAGKSGVCTAWELKYLREEGLRFEPNVVIIQFYMNDITDERPEESGAATSSIIDCLTRLAHRSYALFFLRHRFQSLIHGEESWQRPAEIVVERGARWETYCKALDDLAEVSSDSDIPIVVVLYPHPGEVQEANRIVHRAVAERAQQTGLYVVDLTDAFVSIPPEEQVVSAIDHHPSARVHQTAAVRIVDWLRCSDLLGLALER